MVAIGAIALGACASGDRLQRPAFDVENPAPGVYVHYGVQQAMKSANRGDIANAGFVVGSRCVAVIDTGGTIAVGRALHDAIRAVTELPVCYVINTHGHPDHIFGNAAFVDDHPQFVGHARLAEAIRRRGSYYLAALTRDVGDAATGTSIVLPTLAVKDVERLDLGGRTLVLRAWQTAHTEADLTVLDESSATLWLGDLGFVGHMPVVDGSLRGYIAVLGELKHVHALRAIPGHGRANAWPAAIEPQERYLQRLLVDVKAALDAKKTLSEAVATISFDPSEHWLLADLFHQRNVTAAYAELEWD